MDGKIQYLNTDLDLELPDDISTLASALESRGVFPLHVTQAEDGTWCAWFETEEIFEEPDRNISCMLTAIESLDSEHQTIWSRCTLREFNIGYDCGSEPWAFNQGLSNEVLGRIAAVGASLRVTLYPDRREEDGKSTKDRLDQHLPE